MASLVQHFFPRRKEKYRVIYASCDSMIKYRRLLIYVRDHYLRHERLKHEQEFIRTFILDWLKGASAASGNDSSQLKETNDELASRLIRTLHERGAVVTKDYYSPTTGSLMIQEAPVALQSNTEHLDQRPPLTREMALEAYAWARACHSYHRAACTICSSGNATAYNCYHLHGLDGKLGRRPEILDVTAKTVTVRPEDAVKIAFYHNLLTLYAVAFFSSLDLQNKDAEPSELERDVLTLIKTWDSRLFTDSG